MRFENTKDGEKELVQFVRGQYDTYRAVRQGLALEVATGIMLDAGIQWFQHDAPPGVWAEVKKYVEQYNPERHLRVTVNRISRLVQKTAAATHPSNLAAEVRPPEADLSTTATVRADVYESTTNTMIDASGYRAARVEANYRRAICGSWGVGLAVQMGQQGEATDVLEAFDFDPTHLTLDPHVQNPDLCRHDWVLYTDVWTVHKARRVFPHIKLDEDRLSTVGNLAPLHVEMARFSYGTAFAHFLAHSDTKGVLVHQLHCRDESGRHSQMYVVIDDNDRSNRESMRWANRENPESPIGGNGLPLMLLHAHRRPNSMWSRGDVWMLKGDQKRINLLATLFFRALQRYGWGQRLVDVRACPDGEAQAEDWITSMTNQIGGIVRWKSRDGAQVKIAPPTMLEHPQPPAYLLDMTRLYEDSMVDQAHRAEGNFGVTKTHVSNQAQERALEEADQVLGIRVGEDTELDRKMLGNLLGTAIGMAKARQPRVLAHLKRAGFGPDEFGVIASADPIDHGAVILVRNVRYRSDNARRRDLDAALAAEAITIAEYRREMAGTLDSPLAEEDRFFLSEARRAALRVAQGEAWEPIPLGESTDVFLHEFRKMMVDRRVRRDPAALSRLRDAVSLQQAQFQQDLAAVAGPPEQGSEPVTETPETFDLSAALDAAVSGVQTGAPQGVPARVAG